MPFTWQPRFAPSRPEPPEHDKIYWGIRFQLQMGSFSFAVLAIFHLIVAIFYPRLWQVPLAIGCLTCSILLALLSFPSRYQDAPRFKRLWRPYAILSVTYLTIQLSRILFWAGGEARKWGPGWAVALAIVVIVAFGAIGYFTARHHRRPDTRPEVEQLAQDTGPFGAFILTFIYLEFPPQ